MQSLAALIITELVESLHSLETGDDGASWEKARTYVKAYEDLSNAPEYKGLRGQKRTRVIHNDIRRRTGEMNMIIPPPSFLSHARKLCDVWPEIFGVDHKELPYDQYRRLAVCGLPPESKDELREWAEAQKPRQETLRQRIKEEVGRHKGDVSPDFELKVSNYWKFNSHYDNGAYGGIHPEVYANLIYYYTDPGDVVLDPMAGCGTLSYALKSYKFFQEEYDARFSGKRLALMSDISPKSSEIMQADARVGLPFEDEEANLAIIDPPYLVIADEKSYDNIGNSVWEWLQGMEKIILNVKRCVKPNGHVAVITDDVLRKANHQPIAFYVTGLLEKIGLTPHMTFYNNNPNFVYTMGPAQMLAAKNIRFVCNGCKIIQVAKNEK